MKEFLSEEAIEYTTIDINTGMAPLKHFLKYRDSREEFAEVRAAGRVGLPCLVVNDGEEILFAPPSDISVLVGCG